MESDFAKFTKNQNLIFMFVYSHSYRQKKDVISKVFSHGYNALLFLKYLCIMYMCYSTLIEITSVQTRHFLNIAWTIHTHNYRFLFPFKLSIILWN